ncbi:putative diguanylate cyclase AdrA [Pseudidiomarina piscicola]|uniref:diguanylate cyclase n=1 Tax=Pseudidiomarina piscicola TaxID=2614830 RepID=A0A6S6WMV3_9GAMM|nr:GGDEF domain-containing protein [Pseudidiomarina piscicola]CAB0150802.1 putative diguanylate cyclase AdrA [Pseudidiomarina piscicola]VZT40307.1 putative diguanylate cyclase AdrA [Pseudomonas aeruginosa]
MNQFSASQVSGSFDLWQHFRLLAMRAIYFGSGVVIAGTAIYTAAQSNWAAAAALLCVALGFALIGYLYRNELAPQWINFLVICCLGTLVSVSMKSAGILGVYWMYPILAMVFFMFDKTIFVLVIMLIYALFAAVIYQVLPFDYAWRVAISMLVLIGVGAAFLIMMASMQRRLFSAAATDSLTGCIKREYLSEMAQQALTKAERAKQPVSLVQIDMDSFQTVNDRYGYLFGDKVLEEAAKRIRSVARATDTVIRSNGAEFVVIFPNTTGKDAAELATAMLDRIRHDPFAVKSLTVTVTASGGLAEFKPGHHWGEWLGAADSALYQAKSQGRNRLKLAQ